jgi:hypothetical protein
MKPEIKESESALCTAFIAGAREQGWTAYPETSGWDIVLVRDGLQIGIQAKLTFNATLLRQALPVYTWGDDYGPHYRAVLVPKMPADALHVLQFCGLVGFHRYCSGDFIPGIDPDHWQEWPAKKRIELPDYVPDVIAGASAPVQLTQWKIGALKICALLEIRGHVTREDFRTAGIDHRRWVPMRWLEIKDGVYVRGPKLIFQKQHPEVYPQILRDVRELIEPAKGAAA